MTDFGALPLALQIGIIVLAIVEVGLLVTALVINLRTDAELLTLPRPAWLVISIVFALFGPLAFLIAGRRKVSRVRTSGASRETAQQVIDELYG